MSDMHDPIADLTIDDFPLDSDLDWKIGFTTLQEPLPARLTEVRRHAQLWEGHRIGFSLVYVTRQTKEYYRQGIYHLIHPRLGVLPLMMVPVGPNPEGFMQYEIVIS